MKKYIIALFTFMVVISAMAEAIKIGPMVETDPTVASWARTNQPQPVMEQVQADWAETNEDSPAFIKNKNSITNFVQKTGDTITGSLQVEQQFINGTNLFIVTDRQAAAFGYGRIEENINTITYVPPSIDPETGMTNLNVGVYTINEPHTLQVGNVFRCKNEDGEEVYTCIKSFYDENTFRSDIDLGKVEDEFISVLSGVVYGPAGHIEGVYTTASGSWGSHAEGHTTIAGGDYGSHAEGQKTIAVGEGAHSEGIDTKAIGTRGTHAEGCNTYAHGGWGTHAEGMLTEAAGRCTHAEGQRTLASSIGSHAEGIRTKASSLAAHAEGHSTTAGGTYGSHAEGYYTEALNFATHSAGFNSHAIDFGSFAWQGTVSNELTNFTITPDDNEIRFRDYGSLYSERLSQLLNRNSCLALTNVTLHIYTKVDDELVEVGGSEGITIVAIPSEDPTIMILKALDENGNDWLDPNREDAKMPDDWLDYPFKFDLPENVESITFSVPIYFNIFPYNSHGDGTFNVNPIGGTEGFYIGENNLDEHIGNKITSVSVKCRGGYKYPYSYSFKQSTADTPRLTNNVEVGTILTEGCIDLERNSYIVFPEWTLSITGYNRTVSNIRSKLPFEFSCISSTNEHINPEHLQIITNSYSFPLSRYTLTVKLKDDITSEELAGYTNGNFTAYFNATITTNDTTFSRDWKLYNPSFYTSNSFNGPKEGTAFHAAYTTLYAAASAPGKENGLYIWPSHEGDPEWEDVRDKSHGDRHHHPTNVTWNTSFWGYGLGDFSGIAYHNEHDDPAPGGNDPGGGIYRTCVVVTPRHVVGAAHYVPQLNRTTYWLTKNNQVITNCIVEYKRPRGTDSDFIVGRLAYEFDENDITPVPLLATNYPKFFVGRNGTTSGLFGVPLMTFDCVERARTTGWRVASLTSTNNLQNEINCNISGTYITGSPSGVVPASVYPRMTDGNHPDGVAIGGDSSSPTFMCLGNDFPPILMCCYKSPTFGPLLTKWEVDNMIEEWGDPQRCTEFDLGEDGGFPDLTLIEE